VRYCPRSPTDEGIYIVKLFAADQARFFWEASWQVTIEATGETFRGESQRRLRGTCTLSCCTFKRETAIIKGSVPCSFEC
jgi:hypothetical protein